MQPIGRGGRSKTTTFHPEQMLVGKDELVTCAAAAALDTFGWMEDMNRFEVLLKFRRIVLLFCFWSGG